MELQCHFRHSRFKSSSFGGSAGEGMTQEIAVSGDSHVIEPMSLFTERLPKNLRDKALTQTDFELEEPLTPGGHTVFRTVHAPGYEGWTVSRYRQNTGPTPDWYPDQILRDMDRDGADATVLFSNFALFATYTDDHEVALAHARVYNDWVGGRTGRTGAGRAPWAGH